MISIRAIVGRFSPSFSYPVMEEVLKARPFDFCGIISVGEKPTFFRGVPTENQDWFASSLIRGCEYSGTDWQALQPLDEELIENMRECEAVFMEMVSRLEWKKRVPYGVRKRWYLRHLRFWNDYLTRHRINLYLSAWVPHEIPDIVIYELCKLRKIPVMYFGVTTVRDTSFIEHDWEESAVQIHDRYKELLSKYDPCHNPDDIPLQERFERRYRGLTSVIGETPAIGVHEGETPYWRSVGLMLLATPAAGLRCALRYMTFSGIKRAYRGLQRARNFSRARVFYTSRAVEPDLKRPYVYMPLNFQPEATTVPLAGGYADLVLVAELLHATLPADVLIYVKEHPRQSSAEKRTVDFYRDFAAIPRVRFMPPEFDTFVLREHCRAIAATAGTAGFEAPFRGKPVLLFGHCFYQYAPGMHRIHSCDDCKKAVHEIFTKKAAPTLLQCRLYLKAMEDTCVHGVLDPWCFNVSHLSADENTKNSGAAIVLELEKIFGK